MHIGIVIEDGEAALVGKEVREICVGDREIFPYLAHEGVFIQALIGKREQQCCGRRNFGGGVDRDEGLIAPWIELLLFTPTGGMG